MSLHQGDKESLLQALQDVPHVHDAVRGLEGEGVSLVLEVCKLGFTDVLEYLINQGVQLTSSGGKVGAGHWGGGGWRGDEFGPGGLLMCWST